MAEAVHPADIPAPPVPLSPGMRAGDFIFVSGQVASRPDGSVLVGDFAQEVELTLDNVEAILKAGGAGLGDVVKVNAWLGSALHFARFNEIYARRFPQLPPARTTVVVAFGHPDVRVEIDAIAHLGQNA
ncbi:RidA family protein [Enemella evansiae]|uniref:RidA family protein n=1 Tax=Enemella evansiae TaxID=2016499 RepID=A0A255GLW0_9ACTN|nr:RidA family protein [Enemella evansiae]PFG65801.1 reactive intermediate/imine deaminase [Propionibacteriaceae bacterium ES.041]OYO02037.1 hypothetical protein CGZ97_16710 [Enemella evansiae]OYO02214.1 hypothetical protein CGZ95_06230 [Enemella evansiae]OYO03363.1 hypothetical protein CGZ96_01575 [Enemella evansiae]OYO11206.1 hypothetical protein CGZ98_09065 [Enemella evansiae]